MICWHQYFFCNFDLFLIKALLSLGIWCFLELFFGRTCFLQISTQILIIIIYISSGLHMCTKVAPCGICYICGTMAAQCGICLHMWRQDGRPMWHMTTYVAPWPPITSQDSLHCSSSKMWHDWLALIAQSYCWLRGHRVLRVVKNRHGGDQFKLNRLS